MTKSVLKALHIYKLSEQPSHDKAEAEKVRNLPKITKLASSGFVIQT